MDNRNHPEFVAYYANLHEEKEFPYFIVMKWIFGVFVMVVVAMTLMYFFFTPPRRPVDPKNVLNRQMSQPTLQPRPFEDMKAYRKEEQAVLDSYGWTNKAANKVRIPVARAMELVLERGLPTRSAP